MAGPAATTTCGSFAASAPLGRLFTSSRNATYPAPPGWYLAASVAGSSAHILATSECARYTASPRYCASLMWRIDCACSPTSPSTPNENTRIPMSASSMKLPRCEWVGATLIFMVRISRAAGGIGIGERGVARLDAVGRADHHPQVAGTVDVRAGGHIDLR